MDLHPILENNTGFLYNSGKIPPIILVANDFDQQLYWYGCVVRFDKLERLS